MKKLLVILLVVGLFASAAQASLAFEFSESELLDFNILFTFSTATWIGPLIIVTGDYGDGATLRGDVGYKLDGVGTTGYVGIGNDTTIDLSGYSGIDLRIFNNDNQYWNYKLFAYDGATVVTSPSWTTIPAESWADLTLDISALTPIGIGTDTAGFLIASTIGNADTMHTSVTPEPSTLLLLSLGAVMLRRKR